MSRVLSLFDGRVGVFGLVGLLAAALLCRPLARRWAVSPSVVFLTLASGLLVLLVTVANRGIDVSSDSFPRLLLWWTKELRLPRGPDVVGWILNAALFVPIAFFATVLSHRPSLVTGCLIATSIAIETAQAIFLTGRPDLFDVLANTIGAIVGAALGTYAVAHQRPQQQTVETN